MCAYGHERRARLGVDNLPRLKSALAEVHALAGRKVHPLWWTDDEGVCRCEDGSTCENAGKHPILGGWKKKATSDSSTVRAWWKQYPLANIGCVLVDEWVLDFDAHRPEQAQSHGEFWTQVGAPPPTLRVRTPRQGLHVWLDASLCDVTAITKTDLLDGVELLARGNNVLLWGSTIGTKSYRVESDLPIAPVPGGVARFVRGVQGRLSNTSPEPRGGQGGASGEPGVFGASPGLAALLSRPVLEGARDQVATQLAGSLFRLGMNAESVLSMMEGWNALRVRPPLSSTQLRKCVFSIEGAERGRFARDVREELHRARVRVEAQQLLSQEKFGAWVPPVTIEDSLAWVQSDIPDPVWRVEGLMAEGDNVLLAAQYKSGKTTAAFNLTRALCDQEPFLGHFPVRASEKKGRIGYWNLELSERRVLKWLRELGIQNLDRFSPLNLRGYPVDLTFPPFREFAVGWLRRFNIEVWIFDPFAAGFRGDENSNTEVREFLIELDRIKAEAEVSELVLVHHFGRAKEGGQEHGRGASRLDDWADSRWILSRDRDERFFSAQGRDVEVEEKPLAYDPVTRSIRFLVDGVSRSKGSRVLKEIESVGALLPLIEDYVRQHPGCSFLDLRKSLKGDNAPRGRAIAQARLDGLIVKVKGPNNSSCYQLGPAASVSETESDRPDRLVGPQNGPLGPAGTGQTGLSGRSAPDGVRAGARADRLSPPFHNGAEKATSGPSQQGRQTTSTRAGARQSASERARDVSARPPARGGSSRPNLINTEDDET